MKIIEVNRLVYAKSFFSRLMGYMFKAQPLESEVIIFENCNSIHTFNMKFRIDILYLDINNKVLKSVLSVPKGRILPAVKGAYKVVEAPEGLFSKININEVVIFDAKITQKR